MHSNFEFNTSSPIEREPSSTHTLPNPYKLRPNLANISEICPLKTFPWRQTSTWSTGLDYFAALLCSKPPPHSRSCFPTSPRFLKQLLTLLWFHRGGESHLSLPMKWCGVGDLTP